MTNGHFEMYAALISFRGEGYSISYMFIKKDNLKHLRVIYIIQWLQELKDHFRLNPKFVHVDKDSAQIRAIRCVWENAK
ncbi:hypothetical protein LEN26_005179, partial [Aphanomyces euteiches]